MGENKKRTLLLIVNPSAGMLKLRSGLMDIIYTYNKLGIEVTVMTTLCRGDAARIAYENADRFDEVVCGGGDGTFNEMINGIMKLEKKPLIGYIPAGTTNDFASSMKIPSSILKAVRQSAEGEIKKIDIGKFNDRFFSYVASFGAFTEASYSTPQNIKNTIGHLAYLIEGVNDLSNIRPYKVKVETPEMVLEDEFLFGAVSNSTSLGGLLKLDSQYVDMNDGLFEILLVKKPENAVELQKIISGLLTQQFDGKVVKLFSASEIKFTMGEVVPWSLDGEFEAGTKEITIKNIHDAVNIMI